MPSIYFLPLACGVGCWLCVTIIVYYLFRPVMPVKVAGIRFIGIVPGAYNTISRKLADTVYQQILSNKPQLEKEISSEERIQQLLPYIETQIDEFLRVKLPASMPMIAMLIGDKTIHQVKGIFVSEIKVLFPKILLQYLDRLTTDGKLHAMLVSQFQSTAARSYVQGLEQRCKPLFFKLKLFSFVFGAVYGLILLLL